VSTAAATGHQCRATKASTTRPAARASSEDRENVNSSPAAITTLRGTKRRVRRRNAAPSSNATTNMYALASGPRNVETSRRRK
jgi:hypothetical protein